jgi:hypothetical protein
VTTEGTLDADAIAEVQRALDQAQRSTPEPHEFRSQNPGAMGAKCQRCFGLSTDPWHVVPRASFAVHVVMTLDDGTGQTSEATVECATFDEAIDKMRDAHAKLPERGWVVISVVHIEDLPALTLDAHRQESS